MLTIRQLGAADKYVLPDLVSLLQEAVNGGASLGFFSPLGESEALAYWVNVFSRMGPELVVWVAEEDGNVVGTIQLDREPRPNGRHRAQVGKSMVRGTHRGLGIHGKMLAAAEEHARRIGLKLLILGAEVGSTSERIHLRAGWHLVGRIPGYAMGPDGRIHDSAYFCKQL